MLIKTLRIALKPLVRLCLDILGELKETFSVFIIGDHIRGEDIVMPVLLAAGSSPISLKKPKIVW